MSQTRHLLKIWRSYADPVVEGIKTFEIRRNDRNFKVGDYVRFRCVCDDDPNVDCDHPINAKLYRITYIAPCLVPGMVSKGTQLADEIDVFAIKEVEPDEPAALQI